MLRMTNPSVLIIDDEVQLVRSLLFALKGEGMAVRGTHDGASGLAAAAASLPDIVLLDLRLPDCSGMEVLTTLRQRHPGLPVVMISAHGDTRAAVQAVKAGASDYLTKPFELDDVIDLIHQTLGRGNEPGADDGASGLLIGASSAMVELRAAISRIAASHTGRVLLLGESGTGKALVARSLHIGSPRAAGPFVEVNCAALPEQLIEAELFGAERGAYTGAHQKRTGLVTQADGGTLFLDEIGELPQSLQAKFLHFLENGQYRPIGAGRSQTADLRVIAATNRDLAEEVRAGRFREDLFYRLNIIQIDVPPLRSRGDDVLRLARHFAQSFAAEERCQPIRLPAETAAILSAYPWPGNVRELRNLIERLTILHAGRDIAPADLPEPLRGTQPANPANLAEHMDGTERRMIEQALQQAGGQKGRAAELLGISRHAFKRRLQRLGIGG